MSIIKIKEILNLKDNPNLPENFYYKLLYIPFNLNLIEHYIDIKLALKEQIKINRENTNKLFDELEKEIEEKL